VVFARIGGRFRLDSNLKEETCCWAEVLCPNLSLGKNVGGKKVKKVYVEDRAKRRRFLWGFLI
jgi:hypothetical protein